jgi:hypothetical protein
MCWVRHRPPVLIVLWWGSLQWVKRLQPSIRSAGQSFFSLLLRCYSSRGCNMGLLWRMMFSGMLRRVALVITEVSEELSASFIRVTRIGELGTLAVTSSRLSEMSVLTRATGRNIPEDTTLHSHRRENLKSYMGLLWFPRLSWWFILFPWMTSLMNEWYFKSGYNYVLREMVWGNGTVENLVETVRLSHLRLHSGINLQIRASTEQKRNFTYKTNSVALSPQAKYTDWATATCRRNLVPNVSATYPPRSLISVF